MNDLVIFEEEGKSSLKPDVLLPLSLRKVNLTLSTPYNSGYIAVVLGQCGVTQLCKLLIKTVIVNFYSPSFLSPRKIFSSGNLRPIFFYFFDAYENLFFSPEFRTLK